MTESVQADPEQVLSENATAYSRPWVGVVLGWLVNGAAHFLAGKKRAGVAWFAGLLILQFLYPVCLAASKIPSLLPGFILAVFTVGLWIFMLIRSYRPVPRLKLWGWVLLIVLSFGFWFSTKTLAKTLVRAYKTPTSAMAPTLRPAPPGGPSRMADQFLVEKYAYWFSKPQRGDIVIFNTTDVSPMLPKDQIYTKRVVGLPGDTLRISGGRVFCNGSPLLASPAMAAIKYVNIPGTFYLKDENDSFTVPERAYFVLGDNSANSHDSRCFGPIPDWSIGGRGTGTMSPWSAGCWRMRSSPGSRAD